MFKKDQKNGVGFVGGVLVVIMCSLAMSLTAIEANAGLVFNDDFDDGDLNLGTQWFLGGTGTGSSTANVVELNSKEGHLRQVGANTASTWPMTTSSDVSVSHTFDYAPGLHFEFTMAASAIPHTNANARAGVDFQFNNALGTPIDSYGIMYSTSALSADRYTTILDTATHHYSFSVEDLMSFAGLTPSQMAQVGSVFMKFESASQRHRPFMNNIVYDSTGEVWFDNVNVSTVPEPATLCLLGLGSLACLGKRKS